jgi:hypothetical protein
MPYMMKRIDLSESLHNSPYLQIIFLQFELVKRHIFVSYEGLADPALHNLQIVVEISMELRHHFMIFLIAQKL